MYNLLLQRSRIDFYFATSMLHFVSTGVIQFQVNLVTSRQSEMQLNLEEVEKVAQQVKH